LLHPNIGIVGLYTSVEREFYTRKVCVYVGHGANGCQYNCRNSDKRAHGSFLQDELNETLANLPVAVVWSGDTCAQARPRFAPEVNPGLSAQFTICRPAPEYLPEGTPSAGKSRCPFSRCQCRREIDHPHHSASRRAQIGR
jgi:hypothetical protein